MSAFVKATYSITEAARLMGRPRTTVRRWINAGLIATIELNGQRLIPLAALQTNAAMWRSILLAAKLNAAKASNP